MGKEKYWVGGKRYVRVVKESVKHVPLGNGLARTDNRIMVKADRHVYVGVNSDRTDYLAWGSAASGLLTLTVDTSCMSLLLLRKMDMMRGCGVRVDLHNSCIFVKFSEKILRINLCKISRVVRNAFMERVYAGV